MYLFWHALFAILLALLAYSLIKPNPAWLFLFATTFFGIFPDIDHLIKLFPRYLTEGLSFSLRTHPSHLHLWLQPTIIVITAILARKSNYHECIVTAAGGWALHLALEGVLVLI